MKINEIKRLLDIVFIWSAGLLILLIILPIWAFGAIRFIEDNILVRILETILGFGIISYGIFRFKNLVKEKYRSFSEHQTVDEWHEWDLH